MIEMAVLAKNGIELRNRVHSRPPNIEPTEPIYEPEINDETEVEKRKRDIRNHEKKFNWENHTARVRERGALCNNFSMGQSRCQGEKLYILVFKR